MEHPQKNDILGSPFICAASPKTNVVPVMPGLTKTHAPGTYLCHPDGLGIYHGNTNIPSENTTPKEAKESFRPDTFDKWALAVSDILSDLAPPPTTASAYDLVNVSTILSIFALRAPRSQPDDQYCRDLGKVFGVDSWSPYQRGLIIFHRHNRDTIDLSPQFGQGPTRAEWRSMMAAAKLAESLAGCRALRSLVAYPELGRFEATTNLVLSITDGKTWW
ncbi:hypothetical protein K461DRAFT_281050 [Myriangium duriaei CBS 260.36]|uniref:Uncharacterized protein n=1 Tax=Myriangium duriaei CBS 260.36 TaxID=1168546 RepID=A0A9P4ME49_9PEZI|nr:hypothetical protein K461DRAFT_281050 [Myriangium duriaei CBS 260.36]